MSDHTSQAAASSEPGLPHACSQMITQITDSRVPLEYYPRFREYGLVLNGNVATQLIDFCPFCGTKLPESVREVFFDKLEALGLEIEDSRLPAEFHSDAWWRSSPSTMDASPTPSLPKNV